MVFPHLLGPVQMSKRHVIERLNRTGIHVVGTAHRNRLRIACAGSDSLPCIELVGYEHVPAPRKIDVLPLYEHPYGVTAAFRSTAFPYVLHIGRL